MIKQFMTCLMLLGVTSVASAAELSQYASSKAMKANELAKDGKYDQAITLLKDHMPTRGYDLAYFERMLGVFYWQSEKIKPAIQELTKAVESNELKDDSAWSTRRMLADLLLMDKQYKTALPHYYVLAKTLPKTEKGDKIWLRISQVHYQLGQWKQVLTAMQRYESYHLPDKVGPLSVKVGAQLQLEQWNAAIPTLKRLITIEPNQKNWWMQLVSLEMRVNKRKDALDTLALARLQGLDLGKQDLHLLAQLYAQAGVPERAAQVMQRIKGLNSDVQLVTEQAIYWQRAKEWNDAIKTWKLAAQLDGKYHWNVAQLLSQQGDYSEALAELDRVKDPKRKADVALARTRALYKLNRLDHALSQAKTANRIEPSAEAKSWIKYLTQLKQVQKSRAS
ncbi:hypothetical protein F9817_11955 [Vibrio sp. CAIM 722]|uniref:TPR domain protein n=1 Tax=Vibrio eleionomae TaxID=2653505 RepID=A0A7X4RV33_9VIBR|nr:hypothetical protein [Vibrio eleionomae]MZI93907.1 hypothetical protein [Vibrio eleionomae]